MQGVEVNQKKVVVAVTFTMLREVTEDWDAQSVEFWLNESSHCLSSEVQDLADEDERAEDGCCFTCHRAKAAYLREATPADIEELTPPKPAKPEVDEVAAERERCAKIADEAAAQHRDYRQCSNDDGDLGAAEAAESVASRIRSGK